MYSGIGVLNQAEIRTRLPDVRVHDLVRLRTCRPSFSLQGATLLCAIIVIMAL